MNILNKTKLFFLKNRVLIISIILGIVLRLFSTAVRDFWFDESVTWAFAGLPINQLIPAVMSDSNPPLFYLLMHYLLKISENLTFLRLFSVLINLLCIPLIFLSGKKIFNKTTGLYAALLFSVSALNIYIGSEARLHVLGMFFILLSVYFFYSCLNNPTILHMLILIISLVMSVYTQYYAWLMFPAFMYAVYTSRNQLGINKFIIALTFVIAVTLPWMIPAIFSHHNQCACPNPLLAIPSVFVSPIINGVGEVTLRSFYLLQPPILLLFSISSIVVIFLFIKGIRNNQLLPFFIIPLIILSIAGIFYPVFSPKAFAVFNPIFFLILAFGISKFKQARTVFWMVFVLFLIISLIQITNPFFSGIKFKNIISIIKQNENIPIYHTSITTYYPLVYYLSGKKVNNLLTTNPLSKNTVKYIGGQQNNLNGEIQYLWLITDNKYNQESETINEVKLTEINYSIEKNYNFENITVKLLKHK